MTTYRPYIINLPISTVRKAKIQAEFFKNGIEVCIVEGVDGRKIKDEDIRKCYEIDYTFDGRGLSKGEIGCFLSHRKCWQIFLETDKEWALIGEDDIYLVNNYLAKDILKKPELFPKGVDVVQVGSYKARPEVCRVRRIVKRIKGFELIQMLSPISYGTQLYWINRKAASYLLEKTKKISRPIDNFLFDQRSDLCRVLSIWTLSPFIAYQNDDPSLSIIAEERKDLQDKAIFPENIKKKETIFSKWKRSFSKRIFEKKYKRYKLGEGF